MTSIVVAPHHFPNLDREQALADEFGAVLIATQTPGEFADALPEAHVALVTPYASVTAEDFERMRNCIAVVRYGIGYDNIDVAAARRTGIPVSIVPGTASDEVASHAVAMGLALARRLPAGDAAIRQGRWGGVIGYDAPPWTQTRVGVVGMGRIGSRVAQMYSALGFEVSAFDPVATFTAVPSAPLERILIESDILSLHLPLTDDTRDLIDADVLSRMRKRTIIVNVSRGGLINEAALAQALKSGLLAGAGIDTFSQEPLPSDSPLLDAPNLILSPHIAWRSTVSLGALQDGAVDRVRLALTGEPLPDVVS